MLWSVGVRGEHLSNRTGLGFLVTMVGVTLYKLVPKGPPKGERERGGAGARRVEAVFVAARGTFQLGRLSCGDRANTVPLSQPMRRENDVFFEDFPSHPACSRSLKRPRVHPVCFGPHSLGGARPTFPLCRRCRCRCYAGPQDDCRGTVYPFEYVVCM